VVQCTHTSNNRHFFTTKHKSNYTKLQYTALIKFVLFTYPGTVRMRLVFGVLLRFGGELQFGWYVLILNHKPIILLLTVQDFIFMHRIQLLL